MKTQTFTFIVFVYVLNISVAIAGGQHDGQRRFIKHMNKKLDLTEEQKRKVDVLIKAQRQKRDAFFKSQFQQFESQMQEILQTEQFEKFKHLANQHKRRIDKRMKFWDKKHQ